MAGLFHRHIAYTTPPPHLSLSLFLSLSLSLSRDTVEVRIGSEKVAVVLSDVYWSELCVILMLLLLLLLLLYCLY